MPRVSKDKMAIKNLEEEKKKNTKDWRLIKEIDDLKFRI